MELTLQALQAVEFREARRGGYNTRDVDDFIERVAAGVGDLQERLRELSARAESAESRLLEAQRQLQEAQHRPPAGPTANETDDTLRRTLVLAQRTADATIKEARQEATRLLEEARAEASRTRASAEDEARRGAEQARVSVEAELDDLVGQRDALKADVDAMHRHLDDQRQRIRAGIDELRRIVEDDGQLTPSPAPPLADVDRPAAPPPLPSRRGGFAAGPPGTAPAPDAAGAPAVEQASPFAAGVVPGGEAAALREPPPDAAPPAGPAVAAPFTVPGEAPGSWLPPEPQPSVGDATPPPPAEQAPPNGTESPADPPESRPSEWGRAVFGPDSPEGD